MLRINRMSSVSDCLLHPSAQALGKTSLPTRISGPGLLRLLNRKLGRSSQMAFIRGAVVTLASLQLPAMAANLVKNGSFDAASVGHIGENVTLPDWTKTCLQQCGGNLQANSHGFAFVVDDKAATRPGGGFPALVNTSTEQVYFWGPNNTVSYSNNNFTGSPSGGKFVAIDGDFGRSKLSQTVDNLDPTKTYTFSFEYAGAQQGLNAVDFTGDTTQKWLIDGISASQLTVGPWTNPSKGFTTWRTYTTTFSPASASINLAFTAWGNVVGGGEPSGVDSLPPFLLLDNVQILENPPTPPTDPTPPVTPVPGPAPLLGAGVAFSLARRLRRRQKMSS